MAAYWEIAASSTYDMFSKYKYLIVNLVISHLSFWRETIFLIAHFSDHCLLVPFHGGNLVLIGSALDHNLLFYILILFCHALFFD